MDNQKIIRVVRNYIRISLLLLILPILYLGVWFSISAEDSLTYFEQVQLLMSYFPQSIRNPFGITLTLFGMSMISAVISFYGYLKSITGYGRVISMVIFIVAGLLTFWLGVSLF